MPTEAQAPDATHAAVQLEYITLFSADFRVVGDMPEANETREIIASFSMATKFISEYALGVEISAEISVKPPTVESTIVYRGVFSRPADQPPKPRDDPFWKQVAARIAPITIYPYIRETFTGLAAKAGAHPALSLPIMNVGEMWKPEAIEIQG